MNRHIDTDRELPRVDFYLLPGQNIQALHLFSCRLAEKAWKLGNSVFVRAANEAEARQLDELMWTYSDGSFLPHGLLGSNEAETPVVIGHNTEPSSAHDLLINLATDIPANNHLYQRIAEIVDETPDTKQLGRLRYAEYDKRNYPLHHHNINR